MNTTFLSPRLGAVSGIVGTFVFAAMWVSAILADGHWVLGEMALSELGDRSRSGALFFNVGAIIAGVLGLAFAVGLYRTISNSLLAKAGTAALGASSLLLIGIGFFPIDTGNLHTMASYGFFLAAAIALALLIVPIGRSHVLHWSGGIVTTVLLLVPLAGGLLFNQPIAEALAVVCLMIWTLFISVRMLVHHPMG